MAASRSESELLRALIDTVPMVVAYCDASLRCRFTNRACQRWFGGSPDAMIGRHIRELLGPIYEHDLPDMQRALAGELQELEREIPNPSGGPPRHGLETYVPDVVDGTVRGFFVLVTDVTTQRRVEAEQRFLAEVGVALATSLSYEDTLVRIAHLAVEDMADLCIVELADEGDEMRRLEVTCRDPSKAWLCERLMKVRVDRDQLTLLRSAVETRRAVLVREVTPDLIASVAQNADHLELLRAAEVRSLVAVPLVAHAKILGAIGFVSSSRLYETRDVRLAEELAYRAALSIESARLYLAAQRATKARDDLLGIVAHDLRNPLSTIVVAANLVRRSQTSSDAQMQMIERAAKRMDHLIEELLDVTRIEAGRLSIDAARVDSRELVAEVVTSQRTIATAASLALELDVSEDLPDVWADRNRLLQIFENLMSNALKFTHAGRITVGARPSKGEVVFSVTDTGAGIASDALPSVFDRFWQAARADRRGAGLGLPIVKGLVEAHGGRIWAESAVQRGTTFYFTMPVAVAPELSQTPRMTA